VVRTSVGPCPADFPYPVPDLWLTDVHSVDKMSTIGQSTRHTQPSVSPGSVIHVFTWVLGCRDHYKQTGVINRYNALPYLPMAVSVAAINSQVRGHRQ